MPHLLQFSYIENSLHFNLAYFPGVDILRRLSHCNGRIPEIHVIYFSDSSQIVKIWCTWNIGVLQ